MAVLLTVQDIHRLIEQDCQKMGFFAYDSLETEEVDIKINQEIYSFVEAVIDIANKRIPKIGIDDGFQSSQVSLDSLRTIHVKDLSRTLTVTNNQVTFPLPDDYLHHIKTKLGITYSCTELNAKNVRVTVTKTVEPEPTLRIGESQNIDNMRASSFHKTKKESPLGEIVGETVYIYKESDWTVANAKLDYIKRPAKVAYVKDGGGAYDPTNSVQCDLPPTALYIICNMVAVKILKVIETQQQKIVNLEQQ